MSVVVAAVDLGASGGRVMAGRVDASEITAGEVHRFPNVPVVVDGTLCWDIGRLYGDVLAGLAALGRGYDLASVGIDSWGVDYGLLGAGGELLGDPVHYRDRRTEGVELGLTVGELYAVTGIQYLPFNTIYQLAASSGLDQARTMLMIPDLLGYWLTGTRGAELTNASTTALLDVRTREWSGSVIARAGLPRGLFPPLRQPGTPIGPVLAEVSAAHGLPAGLTVTAVGSHDTASAVVAVPATGQDFAYISSGTWSLVGMELDSPVLTDPGFTNEAGVDGTVRYLRNVMGLWLLQESVRHWSGASLDALLAQAARQPALRFVIDPDDPVFLPAGDIPGRILAWLRSRGVPVPDGPPGIVRCVLDSLALAYRRAVESVQARSGRHVSVVHIVGGGSRNELLCQLTADACGLPVVAGPAEATALGNMLVQARSLGAAPGDLPGLRAVLRSATEPRRYEPAGDRRAWAAAASRIH
jgi:sugar (pentulose or hexulose) kinase